MIASRLVAYHPNGARIGVLPDPASWSGHMPVNGVSALTLSYFGTSAGSVSLADPVEVALEVSAGGEWVEPANSRFLRMVRDRDQVDKSDLWKFSMPGYAHLLKGACVLAAKTPSEANTDKDGKRKFLSANAGTIVKTVLDEARALDPRVLEGLTIDFTTSRDSAGALWSKVITIYYAPGMGLDTIIDNLAAQGVIDWELQGRTLRLFNPDTVLARKLPEVRIHDQDSEQAPIKGTLEGLRHLVLLQGDEGKLWTKENVSAPTPWGKSITFITQGGVSDEGTADTLIQAELDAGSRERVQYTRALTLTEHTPTPFVDYRPGDFIQAHDAAGAWASLRVFALGLGREGGIHKVTLTLGDLFEDALIRQAKRTKGIVGGSSADGGSGARPAPPEPGTRKPMAPAGLVMNSDHYFDARGVAHASVLASYAPATHGVDGLGLTIQAHELFGRQVGSTNPYRMLTSVEGETATIGFSPLPVQTHWDFKVRAIAENGVPSEWSNVVHLELARDTTPPPPPSEPVLTTRLGTVTVTWDGKTELGTPMPADFDYCEVEITDHTLAAEFVAVGEVRVSAGLTQLVIADLPYETATQVRLIAIDSSGSRSAPSEIAEITTKPLVDADLVNTTIFDAIEVMESQVDYAVIAANGKNATYYGPNTPTPPAGGHQVNDTWYEEISIAGQGSSVIIHTWSGSDWVGKPLGNGALAVGSITATNGVIASLDAGVISTGILHADRIGARTITADKVLIGSSENLLVDPGFTTATAWKDSVIVVPATPDGNGGYVFFPPGPTQWDVETGDTAGSDLYLTRVEGGAEYNVSALISPQGGTTYYASFYIEVQWKRGPITTAWEIVAYSPNGMPTGEYTSISNAVAVVAPSDATYVSVRVVKSAGFSGSAYLIAPSIKRVMSSVLIADGAVTAPKILAGSVETDKLAANAVTAVKILAGSVETDKLAANAVDATRLDAYAITAKHTITGAYIQTTATPLRGIKISNEGLWAHNAAGQQTFLLDAASGSAYMTGKLQTGLGNNQVVIADAIFRGRPGMRLDTGSSHDVQPTIQSLGVGSSGFAAGDFVVNGRETTVNSSGRADLVLSHGGDFALKQNWGSNSGIGITKEGRTLELRGQFPFSRSALAGGTVMMEMVRHSTALGPGSSTTWTLTPRPTGTTEALVSPKSAAAQSARPLATHDSSPTSVTVYMARDNSTTTGFSLFIGWNA